MAKKADKGERATFDFSRVGRDWSTKFRNSMMRTGQAAEDLTKPLLAREPRALDDDADDEAIEKYDAAMLKYEAEVNAYYEMRRIAKEIIDVSAPQEQAEMICEVLASVPRSWLKSDAPNLIDWSKVESLDYITPPGYGELLNMIQSGEAMILAKEAAKN